MAKKTETKPRKPAKPATAKKKTTTTTKASKVPQQAENFEHTIRRVVRERERERSEKFGLYL